MKKIINVNVTLDRERAGKIARMHTGTLANNCRMILEAAALCEAKDFYALLANISAFTNKKD